MYWKYWVNCRYGFVNNDSCYSFVYRGGLNRNSRGCVHWMHRVKCTIALVDGCSRNAKRLMPTLAVFCYDFSVILVFPVVFDRNESRVGKLNFSPVCRIWICLRNFSTVKQFNCSIWLLCRNRSGRAVTSFRISEENVGSSTARSFLQKFTLGLTLCPVQIVLRDFHSSTGVNGRARSANLLNIKYLCLISMT